MDRGEGEEEIASNVLFGQQPKYINFIVIEE